MIERGATLWLPVVIGRLCFFVFSVTLVVLGLFFLGNFEGFLDSTQIVLLKTSVFLSAILVVGCLYYGALMIWLAARGKQGLEPLKLAAALVAVLVFGSLYLGARYLLIWL